MALIRIQVDIQGIVQGVGFRPFIHKLAMEHDLNGWVLNSSAGVLLELEGDEAQLDAYLQDVRDKCPPRSRILSLRTRRLPAIGLRGFEIRQSQTLKGELTLLSPDIATCSDCLAELFNPADRRHRYPFINCTNCGPRYSIVLQLPYDRPHTTMAHFAMCPECQAEYSDPADRRYHAQPIACYRCGPQLTFIHGQRESRGEDALSDTLQLLEAGGIVAIKGIGGFHLACRADRDEAVLELRKRKRRSFFKPLAVMVLLEHAEQMFRLTDQVRPILQSPAGPVVLVEPTSPNATVCLSRYIAPNLDRVGIMLPYTPLHHLLLTDSTAPLVMTSANLSDEPIIADNEVALDRLAGIADAFLLHDRPIHARCDDSVLGPSEKRPPQMFRHSRGYSPYPLALAEAGPDVLALGGDIKTTFAASRGRFVFFSPHLGDGEQLETYGFFRHTWEQYRRLFGLEPQVIACDLHPGYHTSRWAAELAEEHKLPLVRVQHHHAHLAALAAELNLPGPQVAIVADGTGYGADGTMWGGEVLRGDSTGFTRIASLRKFPLVGGDAAVKEPWRIALALLHQAMPQAIPEYVRRLLSDELTAAVEVQLPGWISPDTDPRHHPPDPHEVDMVLRLLHNKKGLISTSALGRLFDGVAALLGICPFATYEGQAPMELEAAARRCHAGPEELPLILNKTPDYLEIDWRDVIHGVVAAPSLAHAAAAFHHWAASAFFAAATGDRSLLAEDRLLATGGCMQNALLTDILQTKCTSAGIKLLVPRDIPAGDGGLALGSLMIARSTFPR